MIAHIAPLDWILWLAVIALEFIVLRCSWRKLPFVSLLMVWQILADCMGVASLFNLAIYAKVYVATGIPEYVFTAAAAIELCGKLQPSIVKRLIRFGPAVIAGPIFFQIVLGTPLLALFVFRFHELAYAGAAILLLFSLAFEELAAPLWVARIGWAYLILLGSLILAIELLYRFGNHGIWNRAVPLAWLIGLGALAWSMRGLRHVCVHSTAAY